MNRIFKIFLGIGLLFSVVQNTGCSNRQNQAADLADDPYAYDDYGTDLSQFEDIQPTIPQNLFDNTTASDPAPQASGTITYQPISSTQQSCLAYDNIFSSGFGGAAFDNPYSGYPTSSSTSGCFNPSQDWQWLMGLGMFASMDKVLNIVLAMDPNSDDQAANQNALNLAEMILVRAARNQVRQAWGAGNWPTYQNSSYATTDNNLYNWLNSTSQYWRQ